MRRIITLLSALGFLFASATPALADQAAVDNARNAYKASVAAAVKAHKAALVKAKVDYELAIRMAGDPAAVASAQAKALADQATRISQARVTLEQALADADRLGDKRARHTAFREYDQQLRLIQQQTERALGDAREMLKRKTARERARVVRDQAIKVANENLNKALNDARNALNAVLVANGLPAEKG